MQSHTCTASRSRSFRCDSVRLEGVGSRSLSCLVHRRLLPALASLGFLLIYTPGVSPNLLIMCSYGGKVYVCPLYADLNVTAGPKDHACRGE